MNVRWVAFPVLVLGSIVLGSACTIAGPDVGPGGALVDAPQCILDGDGCNFDDECCSNVCAGGVCASPADISGGGPCIEDDQPCDDLGAADCCSQVCDTDGYCGIAGGAQCAADGEGCSQDSDCCAFVCNGGVCDSSSGSCLDDNSDCTQDADCCSGNCDPSLDLCQP